MLIDNQGNKKGIVSISEALDEAEKNSQHLQKKVIKILIVGGSQGSIFFDKQINKKLNF